MNIELVAPQNVDVVWPAISERIVKCTIKTPTDLTAGDFWTMCRTGHAFLIIAYDEVGIKSASIWRFEDDKFCWLMLVGENSGLWMSDLLELASRIALSNGAKMIVGTGRRGIEPVLRKHHKKNVTIVRHTYVMEI